MSDKIRELLNRIVPRLDAGGPNPIDPELHHCEWMLYQERERIHAEFEAALAQLPAPVVVPDDYGYPPCDYCGAAMDRMPWHGSGTLNGSESRHIHACDACRHLLPAAEQPNAAVMPCGTAVSNVCEAYDAGKKAAEQPDTIQASRELANHREIAELLLSIGWKDTADAQWERLRKALPELHALLSGGDTPYKEIAACANTTGSTPAA